MPKPGTNSMMEYELIKEFWGLIGKWLFNIEVNLTRKRDAKRFLKNGRAFLAKGRFHEADVQFSVALRLCPNIVGSLSQSEQSCLIRELDKLGDKPNATRLRLLINDRQKRSAAQSNNRKSNLLRRISSR